MVESILKSVSFHSSGTTVCEAKLSHLALVRPDWIQNLLALASRVLEPNRRYEVLEKAISRRRIVLLLWETNKRSKRARFNSKQAMKNWSISCSAMFVLIFDFGARACYSTTWYSWRHRFHFYPDPTVHTCTKDIRIRFYPFSRAFPNLYGFGGSVPRVSVDGRPKRIKKYTDSNESTLVWTGSTQRTVSFCASEAVEWSKKLKNRAARQKLAASDRHHGLITPIHRLWF